MIEVPTLGLPTQTPCSHDVWSAWHQRQSAVVQVKEGEYDLDEVSLSAPGNQGLNTTEVGPPLRRQFQTPEGQTRWSENLFNEDDVEEVSRRLREISVQAVWRD